MFFLLSTSAWRSGSTRACSFWMAACSFWMAACSFCASEICSRRGRILSFKVIWSSKISEDRFPDKQTDWDRELSENLTLDGIRSIQLWDDMLMAGKRLPINSYMRCCHFVGWGMKISPGCWPGTCAAPPPPPPGPPASFHARACESQKRVVIRMSRREQDGIEAEASRQGRWEAQKRWNET